MPPLEDRSDEEEDQVGLLVDSRNDSELDGSLDSHRSTLWTVCPFILGAAVLAASHMQLTRAGASCAPTLNRQVPAALLADFAREWNSGLALRFGWYAIANRKRVLRAPRILWPGDQPHHLHADGDVRGAGICGHHGAVI